MDRVIEVDGHWLWTGSVGGSGYGKITEGGRVSRSLLTHRVVWEHHRGPIPEGLVLDHVAECLTITCCNPDHLEPVTQAENRRRQAERRTACNRGHVYTAESTRVGPNGRECRVCSAERESRRRAKLRRDDYVEVCDRGHERTADNTVAQGAGLRCKTCTSEAAQARWAAHRTNLDDNGSGNPAS